MSSSFFLVQKYINLLILIMNPIQVLLKVRNKSCIRAKIWFTWEPCLKPVPLNQSVPFSLWAQQPSVTFFFSKRNINPILFCFTENYDAIMQWSASNNQLCKSTCRKLSILGATLPSTGKQRHGTKKAKCQSFVTSHFSAAACFLSFLTTTQLLAGINPEEVRNGREGK